MGHSIYDFYAVQKFTHFRDTEEAVKICKEQIYISYRPR